MPEGAGGESRGLGGPHAWLPDQSGLGNTSGHLGPSPGLVQKLEGRLPATPRLLLLSGGARRGTLDLNPGVLAPYAPGRDYDVDYTLLVPILDARLPLEPGGCPPGYARLSLAPLGPTVAHRWADCSCRHGQEVDLCPSLVSAHFSRSLVATARQSHSHQGGPEVEQADAHGGLVTLILRRGPLRALYDVAPVVAVWGWPEAAQNWLSYGGHFWEGQVRLEDVAASFYLLPCTGPCPEVCSLGDASGLAWPEACGLLEACCPGNTSSLAWPEACSPLEACAPGKASCLGDSPGPVEACAPGEAHCQGNASGLVEAYAPGKACCPGNSPSPGRCEAFNLVEACCPGNASSLAQPEAYSPVEACCLGNACGKAGPESMEACSLSDPRGRAWRLSFASSEFHLKTAMPLPMRQAVQAALALLAGVLAGPVGPYPILAQALRACDRLPAGYLSREDSVAHCLLGLLDDMAASLLAGTCPHPFLPGCDLLGGRPWPGLALQVAAVRRDPARHLRQVVDRVKMTAKMVAKAGRP